MRKPSAPAIYLALLACAAIAIACGGSSTATTNGSATSQPTAQQATAEQAPGSQTSASQPSATKPTADIGDGGLYIALGDSLSAGIGASDAGRSFVGLVHASLGPAYELMNLGVPGATSQDLLNGGKLDQAVQEITQRKADSNPNNKVRLVTLEIGGNDLLSIYFGLVQTGDCPDVATSLQKTRCVDALRSALDGFRPNLTAALDRLRQADPSLRIMLLTLYNPFGYVPGLAELSDLSLEGKPNTPFPEGLNDVIRDVARGRDDVTVVDLYPLFQGRTPGLISPDRIHPNDAGYNVMADAVIAAITTLRAAAAR